MGFAGRQPPRRCHGQRQRSLTPGIRNTRPGHIPTPPRPRPDRARPALPQELAATFWGAKFFAASVICIPFARDIPGQAVLTGRRKPISMSGAGKAVGVILRRRPCSFRLRLGIDATTPSRRRAPATLRACRIRPGPTFPDPHRNIFSGLVNWITYARKNPGHDAVHRAARADFNVRGWQGR